MKRTKESKEEILRAFISSDLRPSATSADRCASSISRRFSPCRGSSKKNRKSFCTNRAFTSHCGRRESRRDRSIHRETTMNESDLFIEALDRPDPAERAAYLDEACAGDAALRQRLEVLLRAHFEASECLKEPAPFEVAT